ncbi:nuclear transport factor 2 family protein [Kordiimonas sp. SCSIO 12610]|uniref:nuclear transport factor 2 family protein n=1 Tax=Kordiimonas sp. SCSIO 12610 TaxID=2829597 RepID=UPI0021086EEF|nr:nuclear transport factor 2 family protein [Kordiimonas sp. SCSIO 12610]UTW53997.1 nuclear transport factor 2 family protein [Kordiimonas sp. SCSIO 12610]
MTKHMNIMFFAIMACLILPVPVLKAADDNTPDSKSILSGYIDAYNRCDLKTLGTFFHEDIEWLSIEESRLQITSTGKETLLRELADYMQNGCTVRSELSEWSFNGKFVAVRETAFWQSADRKTLSQSATAVYELENNKIRRVWYYPAVK